MRRKIFWSIWYVSFFFIAVLCFAKGGWNETQLARIDKSPINFSFAVFGDNRDGAKIFTRLLEMVNQDDVLFSIDNGDLVPNGEKKNYEYFMKQLEISQKSLLTVIGNHEIYENGRPNYAAFLGDYYYAFSVGNSYFIILDNADEVKLDSAQLVWLKEELSKSQKYKYRFVFFHVPLFDPQKGESEVGHSMKDLNFAQELSKLFAEYNVTMLFAAHIHAYYQGVWGKTPFILSGGAGAPLYGRNAEHSFYHYVKVEVTDNGVTYKVTPIPNP